MQLASQDCSSNVNRLTASKDRCGERLSGKFHITVRGELTVVGSDQS